MMHAQTITELLAQGASDAVAITAPGAGGLSYADLRGLVADTVAALNSWGIGREDRIAIVLPNGPEMASAFLAVAAGAAAAPLNPAYRTEEFEFYLADLDARALIIQHAIDTPAAAVASRLGIPIIELVPQAERVAGSFSLYRQQAASRPSKRPGAAGASDVALVLHTSGTTSRPKMVPLTQRNICASAGQVSDTLRFSSADRGLNIMPLFHIHGLIAGVLAPLAAGGSVCCTPGFNALKFFSWLDAVHPSWYSAVPTMHQAILSRAGGHREIIARNPLRFIRSSSSSLPTRVIHELEALFGCPVIESYGMTEAAHQMTSNPLPPRVRKPGSVGIAAGPQVAVVGESGELLAAGGVGEVVIRGDSVTAGYDNNPKANAEAFVDGWFRTGDQGVIDSEGYLTLTGRLKEIINRGGEKISPREVDEILMDHPAVQQVVTFAVPHDKLGEDVAAAVVLRAGVQVSERELREFAATRLADFKVPRKLLFLDEIPKGATGKLQRIGLAQKLGLTP